MPSLMSASLAIGVLTGLACVTANAQTAAQHNEAAPDFSSNLAGWVAIDPDFVPVPGAVGPITSDPAHPYVTNATARRTGVQPTFRVADLTNPNVKPWAKEIMKRENDKVLAGGVAFTARSSCLPSGVPDFLMYPVAEPIYFLQTPKQVTMIFAGDAQVRRIYLDVPHTASPKPSWYGESVGHYDGDSLVIDTVGMNTKSYVDHYRTPHTEKLHVVERWKLVSPATLEVVLTVEDPGTFEKPWTARYTYRRIERPIVYEEVCAENNTPLFDYHTPTADKPDF